VTSVRSIVVDFDGTACSHDAAEHVLDAFGDPSWRALDEAWERGEITTEDGLLQQAAMLTRPTAELIAFALGHCPMDPTFAPFVAWAQANDIPVSIASDGFEFYIPPLLASVGISDVAIVTNAWNDGGMTFPNEHPECVTCGTCKMNVVLQQPGPVAFIGEGTSDRYAALYADVTFAKDALVRHCETDGVPFVPWNDFDDIRRWLESNGDLPGAVAPVRCLGWRTS
jgi:2,3-diketo-5-methylthio-1-phosphopentane phosphatase